MNKTSIAKQAKAASFLPPAQGLLQRKCACGNHTLAGGECAECAKNKTGLQRKLAIGASNDPLEQEADRVADQVMAAPTHSTVSGTPLCIQRYSGQSNGQVDAAPDSVDRVLASSGRPLAPPLRQDMEQRFGYDFSRVRVHSGKAAEQSALDLNANAYTVGHNIVFGASQFAPGSYEGRRLIAHELTHVVQQGEQAVIPESATKLQLNRTDSGLEREAEPLSRTTTPDVNLNLNSITVFSGKRIARQPAQKSSDKTRKPKQFDTSNAISDDSAKSLFDVDPTNITMTAESGKHVTVRTRAEHEGEFLIRTQIHTHPDFEFVLKQPSEVVGRDTVMVSLSPTGKVGSTLLVFLCYWRPVGSKQLHYGFTKEVSVTVGSSRTSQVDAAATRLKSLEKQRISGGYVKNKEQISAEYESTIAARKLLRDVAGTDIDEEITHLVTRITGSMDRFETARRVGYLQAIEELNAKALDKSADYQAFGISLAGNLLWALAGLVPYAGVALNIPRLTAFFKSAASISRAELVETAFDVVGAMMVQFASGLPTGASNSEAKSKLITTMTNANTAMCEKLRRDVYRLLVAAMGTRPPYADDDFSEYLAELEIGILNSLLGSYSEEATKEGGSYQQQARTDLLHLYLVTSSAVRGGELGPTQSVGENNFVKDTINLLGGVKKLGIGQWELVGNQMRGAAALLGYQLERISDEQIGRSRGLVYLKVTPVVRDAKERKKMWKRLAEGFVLDISIDELSSISDEQLPEVVGIFLWSHTISEMGDDYSKVYSADRLDIELAKGYSLQGPLKFYVYKLDSFERGRMKQAMKPGMMDRMSD